MRGFHCLREGLFLAVGQGLSLAFSLGLGLTLDLAGQSRCEGFWEPPHHTIELATLLRGEPTPVSMTTSVLAPFTNDVAFFVPSELTSKSHLHVFPSHMLDLVSLTWPTPSFHL